MNEQAITDEQRKAFADLIKQSQSRFEDRCNAYLKSVKDEWAPKLDEKSKVRRFMEDIRTLRSKISEAAENLRRMGFRVLDDGLISVDYDVTRDSRRELEESIKATEVERDQQEARYRKALFDVWSSQSVDQAREIVSRIVS